MTPAEKKRRSEAAWRLRNKHSEPARNRAKKLRIYYDMSMDQYAEMLSAQGGKCAICGCPPPAGKNLHVEHCHRTSTVRGLSCPNCNRGIGLMRDDPAILRRAAAYLERHAPPEVSPTT